MNKAMIRAANKRRSLVALVGAVAVGAMSAANATVDASVATAFTQIQADGTTIAGYVTPVVVAFLGLLVGIKLIKRFGNKV